MVFSVVSCLSRSFSGWRRDTCRTAGTPACLPTFPCDPFPTSGKIAVTLEYADPHAVICESQEEIVADERLALDNSKLNASRVLSQSLGMVEFASFQSLRLFK